MDRASFDTVTYFSILLEILLVLCAAADIQVKVSVPPAPLVKNTGLVLDVTLPRILIALLKLLAPKESQLHLFLVLTGPADNPLLKLFEQNTQISIDIIQQIESNSLLAFIIEHKE